MGPTVEEIFQEVANDGERRAKEDTSDHVQTRARAQPVHTFLTASQIKRMRVPDDLTSPGQEKNKKEEIEMFESVCDRVREEDMPEGSTCLGMDWRVSFKVTGEDKAEYTFVPQNGSTKEHHVTTRTRLVTLGHKDKTAFEYPIDSPAIKAESINMMCYTAMQEGWFWPLSADTHGKLFCKVWPQGETHV